MTTVTDAEQGAAAGARRRQLLARLGPFLGLIAVIAILKTAKVSRALETKIAGESMFNDGVARLPRGLVGPAADAERRPALGLELALHGGQLGRLPVGHEARAQVA